MDSHLHFDLDKNDLLDNSEEVFKVDTHSSSLHELPMGTISRDVDVEKGKASNST